MQDTNQFVYTDVEQRKDGSVYIKCHCGWEVLLPAMHPVVGASILRSHQTEHGAHLEQPELFDD